MCVGTGENDYGKSYSGSRMGVRFSLTETITARWHGDKHPTPKCLSMSGEESDYRSTLYKKE